MIPDLAQNIDLHLFKQSVLNGSLLSSLWTPSLKDVTMLLFVKPLSRRVAFALLFTAWITPPRRAGGGVAFPLVFTEFFTPPPPDRCLSRRQPLWKFVHLMERQSMYGSTERKTCRC